MCSVPVEEMRPAGGKQASSGMHGDAYGLIWQLGVQGELWIIDVSQSVDLDHPRALDFLREDAAHVNSYFQRAGVATLTTRELFEFAVDPNINPGNINEAIEALIKVSSCRPDATGEDEIAAKVRPAATPRSPCSDLADLERCKMVACAMLHFEQDKRC